MADRCKDGQQQYAEVSLLMLTTQKTHTKANISLFLRVKNWCYTKTLLSRLTLFYMKYHQVIVNKRNIKKFSITKIALVKKNKTSYDKIRCLPLLTYIQTALPHIVNNEQVSLAQNAISTTNIEVPEQHLNICHFASVHIAFKINFSYTSNLITVVCY